MFGDPPYRQFKREPKATRPPGSRVNCPRPIERLTLSTGPTAALFQPTRTAGAFAPKENVPTCLRGIAKALLNQTAPGQSNAFEAGAAKTPDRKRPDPIAAFGH